MIIKEENESNEIFFSENLGIRLIVNEFIIVTRIFE